MSAKVADLPPLADSDNLGRGVYSSREAKRARKDLIMHTIFLEQESAESLSVDRLDIVSDEEMVKIGDQNAQLRGADRRFYGWATVTVILASQDGRTVRATPRFENRYHADIDLNVPEGAERRERQEAHANALAANAEWRSRPE